MIKAWIVANQIWLWLIGALVAVYIGWYIINANIEVAKAVAVAEVKDKQLNAVLTQYKQDQQTMKDYMEASQKVVAALTSQQETLKKTYQERETKLKQQLQEVTKPKTTEDVIADFQKYLGITAAKAAENAVTLPASQAQLLMSKAIEDDAMKLNNESLKQQLALEQQKNVSLQSQLDKAMLALEEDRKVIAQYKETLDAYKSVAKKSKFRRTMDFVKPIAIGLMVGVVAGQISHN